MPYSRDDTLQELTTESGVLRYHDVGEGPPLVLIHGSGPGVTGWRNFAGNLDAFAPHFRCLIVELPGFGVSDPTELHPMMVGPSTVAAFADALDLPTYDIVGNSMGGLIGCEVAIAHPERVRRLVTIGGIGRNLLSPGPGEGIVLLQDFTEEPSREALIRWLHSMVFDPAVVTEEMIEERWAQATEPSTLASARTMYSRAAFQAGQAFMAASKSTPAWAKLHRIQAETLVCWGRDDRVSPLDMALLPMRTIPRGELHVFPNCGHWVMIEAKQAWESAVLAFLTRD